MNTNEIFEYFKNLVFDDKLGNKITLARIYGAYEREKENIEKNKVIEEKVRKRKWFHNIHRITDDMAIVEYHGDMCSDRTLIWYEPVYNENLSSYLYKNYDIALIAAISQKNGNIDATEYICKMLDIKIGE